jgi:hypothetical protein
MFQLRVSRHSCLRCNTCPKPSDGTYQTYTSAQEQLMTQSKQQQYVCMLLCTRMFTYRTPRFAHVLFMCILVEVVQWLHISTKTGCEACLKLNGHNEIQQRHFKFNTSLDNQHDLINYIGSQRLMRSQQGFVAKILFGKSTLDMSRLKQRNLDMSRFYFCLSFCGPGPGPARQHSERK